MRPNAVAAADMAANGWQHYFNETAVPTGAAYSPHYGAQPAAYFLFAGEATGLHALFTAPARAYVRGVMGGFEAGEWRWCESMTNELGVLLLTAAWLVRVDDTPRQRAWLARVANALLDYQVASGGIKQFFGAGDEAGKCRDCPPTSNAAYGSGEAPLMFDGSEPLTDALYSTNFVLLGLREAVGATGGDPRYVEAEARLGEYLARTQVVSEAHPELAGAWFRAFDYERWEYWASDSDWGYGPWVTDGGWTNGNMIMTAIALRLANTTLYDTMMLEAKESD